MVHYNGTHEIHPSYYPGEHNAMVGVLILQTVYSNQ